MWIYKPRNDYGGSGCHVYDIRMPQFHAVLKVFKSIFNQNKKVTKIILNGRL